MLKKIHFNVEWQKCSKNCVCYVDFKMYLLLQMGTQNDIGPRNLLIGPIYKNIIEDILNKVTLKIFFEVWFFIKFGSNFLYKSCVKWAYFRGSKNLTFVHTQIFKNFLRTLTTNPKLGIHKVGPYPKSYPRNCENNTFSRSASFLKILAILGYFVMISFAIPV